MKKLGKNKKKQWRHCYKNLESSLDEVSKKQQISRGGFVVGSSKKPKTLVKGDINAAKIFADIPTIEDGRVKLSKPKYRPETIKHVDLWASDGEQSSVKTVTTVDLPLSGQSYNPSITDHYTMLAAIAAQEQMKDKTRLKHERFMASFKVNSKNAGQFDDAKSFLRLVNDESGDHGENIEADVTEADPSASKRKKVKSLSKRMSVDLENIPKLLKQIRREDKARALRKKHLAFKKAARIQMKKQLDCDIPFQMPEELPSCLRNLTPAGNLLWELEKRKNKCPRSRRTLGLIKNTKTFDKR